MTPRFLPNDIIKDGDYFHRVHGMLGEVVLTSDGWRSEPDAKRDKLVSAFHPSDYADWTIVERDGKPYVQERWKPELVEVYYYPIPARPNFYEDTTWCGDYIDKLRLERGLVFRTAEEAIQHAKKMLEVK